MSRRSNTTTPGELEFAYPAAVHSDLQAQTAGPHDCVQDSPTTTQPFEIDAAVAEMARAAHFNAVIHLEPRRWRPSSGGRGADVPSSADSTESGRTIGYMSATAVRVGVLLAIAAGLVAGCSDNGKQEHKPAASPTGRTFVSTSVGGAQIPGGGPMTLTFTDGKISANSGCNTANGTVDLTNGILHVGSLASTLMACPDERGQADSWQERVLTELPKWRLDDSTLTLTAKDTTVTLLDKKIAQPDRPLIGTTWIVSALMTPDAQIRSQTLDDVKPTLTIAADGGVSGSAGCNRMTGHATPAPTTNGPDVTFQIGTTKMTCAPEIMEVEQAVLKALEGKTTATIDADTLTLRNTNGAGLTLRAA